MIQFCSTVLCIMMIIPSLSSTNYNTIECVTMDCKMKRRKVKLPRNLISGDPYAYYQNTPYSPQSYPFGYPNYNSYYGYPVSNPSYAYQNPLNYYTGYTGSHALQWSYSNQIPQVSSMNMNAPAYNSAPYEVQYCRSCPHSQQPQTAVHIQPMYQAVNETENPERAVVI
jgi:hypothetical protein